MPCCRSLELPRKVSAGSERSSSSPCYRGAGLRVGKLRGACRGEGSSHVPPPAAMGGSSAQEGRYSCTGCAFVLPRLPAPLHAPQPCASCPCADGSGSPAVLASPQPGGMRRPGRAVTCRGPARAARARNPARCPRLALRRRDARRRRWGRLRGAARRR